MEKKYQSQLELEQKEQLQKLLNKVKINIISIYYLIFFLTLSLGKTQKYLNYLAMQI